jgi:predicted transcriptional regulator
MVAKRTGDIMMPLEAFPFCPYWFTLRQALAEVEDMEIKRAIDRPIPWLILVFSAQNQLLGIVRRREILQGIKAQLSIADPRGYTPEVDKGDMFRLGFSPSKVLKDLRRQMDRQIIEFMSPIKTTVSYDDHVLIVLHTMIDRDLSFLPVSRDGSVIGIVYAEDALHEVITQIT